MRIAIYLLLFCACISSAFGFDSKFTNFTCSDPIMRIIEDDHNKWIISFRSIRQINKYNNEITIHSPATGLKSTSITREALLDKDHRLWVATNDFSVQFFDGSDWHTNLVTTKAGTEIKNSYLLSLDSTGRVWAIGGSSTVNIFDKDQKKIIQINEYFNQAGIYGISTAPNGDVWLYGDYLNSSNNVVPLVLRYSDDSLSSWTENIPKNTGSSGRVTFCFDSLGNVWIATCEGYSFFDGKSWHLENKSYVDGNGPYIQAVKSQVSPQNEKWFCGFYGIDILKDSSWLRFRKGGSLLFDLLVRDIFFSRDTAWVITDKAISRYVNGNWENFPLKDLGLNIAYGFCNIYSQTGSFTVISDSGYAVWNGSKWQKCSASENELPFALMNAILIDNKDNLWIANDGESRGNKSLGISFFDGKNWKLLTKKDGFLTDTVYDIKLDNKGFIWISERGGISRYDGKRWVNFSIGDGMDSIRNYRKIACDSAGNVYVADELKRFLYYDSTFDIDCYSTSLYFHKFDGSNWISLLDTSIKNHDNIFFIQDLEVDRKGVAWLATFKRLLKFENNIATLIPLENSISKPNALNPRGLAIDKDNLLWIGYDECEEYVPLHGKGGLSNFDGTNWKHFTFMDGLPVSYEGTSAIQSLSIDNEGNKWMGTYTGVSKFDGKSFQNYDVNDGLLNNIFVLDIDFDSKGNPWFMVNNIGLSKLNLVPDGIEDKIYLTKSEIEIYPNPSGEYISIKDYARNLPEIIEIYSIEGIKVLVAERSNRINISALAPGTYFIKLKNGINKFTKI